MNNDGYKEVYFDKYCETCEFKDRKEYEDPCYECLAETVNLYSHKPVYWREEKNRRISHANSNFLNRR